MELLGRVSRRRNLGSLERKAATMETPGARQSRSKWEGRTKRMIDRVPRQNVNKYNRNRLN